MNTLEPPTFEKSAAMLTQNLPLVLNADSEATVVIGIAKISLAIILKVG